MLKTWFSWKENLVSVETFSVEILSSLYVTWNWQLLLCNFKKNDWICLRLDLFNKVWIQKLKKNKKIFFILWCVLGTKWKININKQRSDVKRLELYYILIKLTIKLGKADTCGEDCKYRQMW